jgi:hypothetical protein
MDDAVTETVKGHRRQHSPTHDRIYCEGGDRPGAATEPDKATWVQLENSRYGDAAGLAFHYPGEMELVLQLEKMLRIAFARGREAAQEEMRKALGIIE